MIYMSIEFQDYTEKPRIRTRPHPPATITVDLPSSWKTKTDFKDRVMKFAQNLIKELEEEEKDDDSGVPMRSLFGKGRDRDSNK